MKLIIGGAFQGKKEYAKQQFQISQEKMLDGAEASYEALFQCTCMFHFHEWIKRGQIGRASCRERVYVLV